MPSNETKNDWVQDVLSFWFTELTPQQWFVASDDVDETIIRRFPALHAKLAQSQPPEVATDAETALAAVIVLDQFPRNLFRNTAKAFATDELALGLAQQAINNGLDAGLAAIQNQFLYMPFQHSEARDIQARSIELYARMGDADVLDFAQRHKTIIDRFGRFPHRNDILGRASTPEEAAFLEEPGSSF